MMPFMRGQARLRSKGIARLGGRGVATRRSPVARKAEPHGVDAAPSEVIGGFEGRAWPRPLI